VAEIMIPGGIQNHGAMVMTLMLCASLSMFPQLGSGTGKIEEAQAASSRIAYATPKVAATTTNGTMLGRGGEPWVDLNATLRPCVLAPGPRI
jgi:hypothetical protein